MCVFGFSGLGDGVFGGMNFIDLVLKMVFLVMCIVVLEGIKFILLLLMVSLSCVWLLL